MASAQPPTVKVIDQCQVSPPPASVSTTTFPLTFFDMAWLFCRPLQRIFFYEFSYPRFHFTQTVLPHLKESLSLTLRHFFPFAANLTCPPPPYEPYILYKEGDSLQVTVVESDSDFNYLVANHARDVKTLQSLVPKLLSTSLSSDTTHVVPTMAIQFTVFPNKGISIGLTFNHMAADGRSFNHFMKFWASVHRSKSEDLNSLSLPYHNKDIVKDPNGLSSIFLKDSRTWEISPVGDDPSDNLLVTFVIDRAKIEQLKQYCVATLSKNGEELAQVRITTYVVTCAFMWVNLMKLQETSKGSVDDDMLYYFSSSADCRERFEFSIPGTYFGNCLAYFFVSAKRKDLMEGGIVFAAKVIGRKVCELSEGSVLVEAEKWVSKLEKIVNMGRLVSVAGSPKFRVYETDFGWGKPKKSDVVHIGAYGSFSLNESREEEGGVQIGVVVERDKLDLFNAGFQQGLNIH
ncbi:hypothetical protein JRO89_XS01G0161100 [Xanthoceras sorbifolium]|uniref:Uncharacterized protein n=1 Tax=Xanthoceras sorbifolium TaxID=99658 RepID=A0ABQ8IJK5_9ROSI|nr:hypothetical protein JRO89_XS01G0161100 [Xanthoceras sorbifolium]